ncbi:hypothetical protein MXAN_0789 [Myxococcus xanthus DK 1622]|uniref:Uncharacterized protein n=1 Tax=Myxococcus xanthus (strain DK1622) TaxID=246197 RepID=Q1DE71_MYXXD|nr:hypothetical protein MXAN_0789 [Myxococcus xanthus DK 1622]
MTNLALNVSQFLDADVGTDQRDMLLGFIDEAVKSADRVDFSQDLKRIGIA